MQLIGHSDCYICQSRYYVSLCFQLVQEIKRFWIDTRCQIHRFIKFVYYIGKLEFSLPMSRSLTENHFMSNIDLTRIDTGIIAFKHLKGLGDVIFGYVQRKFVANITETVFLEIQPRKRHILVFHKRSAYVENYYFHKSSDLISILKHY